MPSLAFEITAFAFDGVLDLMKLWDQKDDLKEQELIIADIQDMVDDCNQSIIEGPYIRFEGRNKGNEDQK